MDCKEIYIQPYGTGYVYLHNKHCMYSRKGLVSQSGQPLSHASVPADRSPILPKDRHSQPTQTHSSPKKIWAHFSNQVYDFLTRIFTQANNFLGKAAHSDDFQIIFCGDLHLEMIERAIEQKRGLEFYLHLIHNELERGRQKMPQMMNWPQNMQILFSTTDKWIQADFGQLYNIYLMLYCPSLCNAACVVY